MKKHVTVGIAGHVDHGKTSLGRCLTGIDTDRQGLGEIRRNIEEKARKVPGKHLDSPFRLWIDQVKGFPGYETVVSGIILSGRLRQDDPLQLLRSGIETRARSMETHHKNAAEAWAGQRSVLRSITIPQ